MAHSTRCSLRHTRPHNSPHISFFVYQNMALIFLFDAYFLNIFDKYLHFPSLEGNFPLTRRCGPGCSIKNWSKIFAFSSETDRAGCSISFYSPQANKFNIYTKINILKNMLKKIFFQSNVGMNSMYVQYVQCSVYIFFSFFAFSFSFPFVLLYCIFAL